MGSVREKSAAVGPLTALLVVDLLATLFSGLEGGAVAVEARLDLLGILVLAFATALGGGIVRDVLIGAVPPNAVRDWRYPATALAGGAAMLFGFSLFTRMPPGLVVTLDAAGLALFAVAGAEKATAYGVHPLGATLWGGIRGGGGGVLRDLLLNRVSRVLNADVYATAALAGAALTVVLLRGRVPKAVAMTVGAVGCFGLRLTARHFGWNLPHVRGY